MNFKKVLIFVSQAIGLFLVFLVVGVITRFPALMYPSIYALHGVLSGPIYAGVAYYWWKRFNNISAVVVGIIGLAALLGSMNTIMGISFILSGLLLFASYLCEKNIRKGKSPIYSCVIFAASNYLVPLSLGISSGSFYPSTSSYFYILLLSVITIGLSLLIVICIDHLRAKRD